MIVDLKHRHVMKQKQRRAFYILPNLKKRLMRKEFRSLISLEEAQSIVLSRLPRVAKESVPLREAQGHILAEKVISPQDVPGFSRASMDGFALRAKDTLAAREDRHVCLRLAGSVPMGVLAQLRVAQGERVLIRRPVFCSENVQDGGARDCGPRCSQHLGDISTGLQLSARSQ
jgi:hypothetical protein